MFCSVKRFLLHFVRGSEETIRSENLRSNTSRFQGRMKGAATAANAAPRNGSH